MKAVAKSFPRLGIVALRGFALLTAFGATTGCVVPESLPALHIRGKVVEGATGEAVAYSQVTVKWREYGPDKPHLTYGPIDTDLGGNFSFTISPQLKIRGLLGGYHNFPNLEVHHATLGEASIAPAYMETKNPYAEPVVLRLFKGSFYKPQVR